MPEKPGSNGHITRKDLVEVEQRLMEAMRDIQTEILRGLERFSRGNFNAYAPAGKFRRRPQ
jgi:hypothetical protein